MGHTWPFQVHHRLNLIRQVRTQRACSLCSRHIWRACTFAGVDSWFLNTFQPYPGVRLKMSCSMWDQISSHQFKQSTLAKYSPIKKWEKHLDVWMYKHFLWKKQFRLKLLVFSILPRNNRLNVFWTPAQLTVTAFFVHFKWKPGSTPQWSNFVFRITNWELESVVNDIYFQSLLCICFSEIKVVYFRVEKPTVNRSKFIGYNGAVKTQNEILMRGKLCQNLKKIYIKRFSLSRWTEN